MDCDCGEEEAMVSTDKRVREATRLVTMVEVECCCD